MKEAWARLGRRDSLNLITFCAVVALQFVGSYIGTNVYIDGREWLFVCVCLASLIPVGMVFATGRYFLLPYTPAGMRPLITLLVFQAGCLLRAWSFDSLLVDFGFESRHQFWLRVYGSQLNLFVGAILVTNLVILAREFSERNAALLASVVALEDSRIGLAQRLAKRRDSLINSIRAQLTAALSELTGNNLDKDARDLQSLIDDVVRPISHQLGRDFTSTADGIPLPTSQRVQWRAVIREALEGNPIHPLWSTAWFFFGAIPFFANIASDQLILLLGLSVPCFLALFYGLHLAWRAIPSSWGIGIRAVLLAALPASAAVVLNGALQEVLGVPVFTMRLLLAESGYFVATVWALALVSTVWSLLRRTNQELRAVSEELRRRLISENTEARHFEAAISRILHGPVQDAVAAALKRVKMLPQDATLSPSDLALVRQPINDALALLSNPEPLRQDVKSALGELSTLWSGVVTITLELEDVALEALSLSPGASGTVIEILREAISNSIRHGDAKNVAVRLSVVDDDIAINVTNDGSPVPFTAQAGIGTQLLDDFALAWSRVNGAKHVELYAVIPLWK